MHSNVFPDRMIIASAFVVVDPSDEKPLSVEWLEVFLFLLLENRLTLNRLIHLPFFHFAPN